MGNLNNRDKIVSENKMTASHEVFEKLLMALDWKACAWKQSYVLLIHTKCIEAYNVEIWYMIQIESQNNNAHVGKKIDKLNYTQKSQLHDASNEQIHIYHVVA